MSTGSSLRGRVAGDLATADECDWLSSLFAQLCRIESPSGQERACAQLVEAELQALGLEVAQDDAGRLIGGDCGNLLARIPAREGESGGPGVLLCAHLDTVPPETRIEPVLVDGFWENANDGILGADNKAAVAVMLGLARAVTRVGSPVDVELLFTVGEEQSLAGARALRTASLRSDIGYVFDHASPIGEVVVATPCHFRIEASFQGVAAHAGARPQDGRSAILAAARAICGLRLGRLEDGTTVNVGTIEGGSAMNVVPERCDVVAEVRGLQEKLAEETVAETIDALQEAANMPECECDVQVRVQRTCGAHSTAPSCPALKVAERALRANGYEPVRIVSGGSSDANALAEGGLRMVNLANGTERNHEPGERVSVGSLHGMLDVALGLLEAAAAEARAATERRAPVGRASDAGSC